MGSNTEEYVLQYPFLGIDKQKKMSVMVRRMRASDLMAMVETDTEMQQTCKLIGLLCELELKKEVAMLDIVDFTALNMIIKKQQTGTDGPGE